jgi:HEAT repeat protein
MARDYLQEASSVIFKDSVSLGSLLDTDPDGVVGNLLRVVATAQGMMGPTLRKAAAYALGQIGEPRSVRQLREFYDQEPADGVRDAMRASLTAIKLAPAPAHSQMERRQIIEDVYHDRKPADWD